MKELRSKGFSLLELLLVLMVLGIVAVAAIPDFSSETPQKLEFAANEIAGAMRYARSEAIRTGELRGFHLQHTEARIRVISADTTSNPMIPRYDVEHPSIHNYYDINLGVDPYAGNTRVDRNATFYGQCNDPDLIYFDIKGMPWCGDTGGPLLEQYDVTLTHGSYSRVVSLDGITGRVILQ